MASGDAVSRSDRLAYARGGYGPHCLGRTDADALDRIRSNPHNAPAAGDRHGHSFADPPPADRDATSADRDCNSRAHRDALTNCEAELAGAARRRDQRAARPRPRRPRH